MEINLVNGILKIDSNDKYEGDSISLNSISGKKWVSNKDFRVSHTGSHTIYKSKSYLISYC